MPNQLDQADVAPTQQRAVPPVYTFENFAVGAANIHAYKISRDIAELPYNPVMIHCLGDFGKTHLLQAACCKLVEIRSPSLVRFYSGHDFATEYTSRVRNLSVDSFVGELSSLEFLAIDDADVLFSEHPKASRIFIALIEKGVRLLFSSARLPLFMDKIDTRLSSFILQGVVCAIEEPDEVARITILKKKIEKLQRVLVLQDGWITEDILAYLAENWTGSVRRIEGSLNILAAHGGATEPLDLWRAKQLLNTHLGTLPSVRVTVDEIQKKIAIHFGMTQATLISDRRDRETVRPRQIAMWLSRQLTTRSLPDIGRRFGGRDHTTVLHSVRRIEELRLNDPKLQRDLDQLHRAIAPG